MLHKLENQASAAHFAQLQTVKDRPIALALKRSLSWDFQVQIPVTSIFQPPSQPPSESK